MTRIDPNRIADVFRLLSLDKPATAAKARRAESQPERKTNAVEAVPARDPETLRERLRARLSRLKREAPDFETLAPEVTVREILIWEFGEEILNHPDFQQVASSVAETMQASNKVQHQLARLISQITE